MNEEPPQSQLHLTWVGFFCLFGVFLGGGGLRTGHKKTKMKEWSKWVDITVASWKNSQRSWQHPIRVDHGPKSFSAWIHEMTSAFELFMSQLTEKIMLDIPNVPTCQPAKEDLQVKLMSGMGGAAKQSLGNHLSISREENECFPTSHTGVLNFNG